MGSSQSRSMSVLRYFDKEWEPIQTNKHGVKIYRNRDSDQEAEMHHLIINNKTNLLTQYDIYNYRRTQDNALVAVYAVENMKEGKPNMCGDRDCLRVLTESIPVRGTDLNNLSRQQGIYMLSQCLRGFSDCYSKVGGFDCSDNMVGLNNKGHVKVWLNQNFPENHPTHEKPILQMTVANQLGTKYSQEEVNMLEGVVGLVDRKVRGGLPEDLKSTLKKQHRFVDSYHTVGEYCRRNSIDIPDRIVLDNPQTYYNGPFGARGQVNEVNRAQVSEVNRTPVNKVNIVENSSSRNDNFSFKDYGASNRQPERVENPSILISSSPQSQLQPQSERQYSLNPSRQTLINRLPRDTLVSKYQRQSRAQNVNAFQRRQPIASKPSLFEPPNLTRYESTYQYQPKISVRNLQKSQLKTPDPIPVRSPPTLAEALRAPSPSPRGFNFSYQKDNQVQRQVSPVRTNFVTSQRF